MDMGGKKTRPAVAAARARKDDENQKHVEAKSTLKSKAWKALPAALAPLLALPHWVLWRYQQNEQGKPTKVPYQPQHPERKASTKEPSHWDSHEVAVEAAAEFDGIGFVLTGTPFAAFDIDDCRDAETGKIDPWALALVERADSYTEITVSGTGLICNWCQVG